MEHNNQATPNYYDNMLRERVQSLHNQGDYRYFLNLAKSSATFPIFSFEDENGLKKSAVNWCSNDYLGMSVHPEVAARAQEVIGESGLGSGGTRNISGSTVYHRALEEAVAKLHEKESALIFNSAFLANATSLAALGAAFNECAFISDERNHSSMIEGMRSSKCPKYVFSHNSPEHCEEILKTLPAEQPKIIAFESVYSINGSIAPLCAFADLAERYNALTYLDEVHAVGVYGHKGAGMAQSAGCAGRIDIINGTFAKAFGVLGGYITANRIITEYIRSFAPGFIFTTSLPPALCAGALASIEHVGKNIELQETYRKHIQRLRRSLIEHGVPFSPNNSHITPIPIGDTRRCKVLADTLLHEYGVYLQPINKPTVPAGEECLRITITTRHSEEQIEYLARSLAVTLIKIQ